MTTLLSNLSLFSRRFWLLSILLISTPPLVNASIVVNGTRLIYPAEAREISVKLDNAGKNASLIQVWLDEGDAQKSAADIVTPFVITPPVARVNPGKAQTIRLMLSGPASQGDKEVVYWFNVLDIPAESANSSENKLQLAYRTRIKLFFRPQAIKGKVEDAPAAVEWRSSEGGLRVKNHSAFHVTFVSATLSGSNISIDFDERFMMAPGEERLLKTPRVQPKPGERVDIKIINDFGGVSDLQAQVQ